MAQVSRGGTGSLHRAVLYRNSIALNSKHRILLVPFQKTRSRELRLVDNRGPAENVPAAFAHVSNHRILANLSCMKKMELYHDRQGVKQMEKTYASPEALMTSYK